ncbi:acetyl ornithine aminotransferase family protein [Chloroflexales bacterium ZM16-3]|nr:acetyl ornithine aminotransferase family protein [Chloroflexales bacterium ZM16-3]
MTAPSEPTSYTIEYMPGDLPGPKAKALVARDGRVMAPMGRVYPLVIDHAQGCEVWDVDGNRFLDVTSGIAVLSAGHCHPRLIQVAQEQLTRFTHMAGTDFYNEPMIRAAEKLVSLMPGGEGWQVFFTNSGTEAVEASIKLARYATGRQNIIGFYSSFHGRSYGSLSLTASKARQRRGFFPLLPGTFHAFYANPYRPPLNSDPERVTETCLGFIENTLFQTTCPPDEVAAIIVEPIQGEGGYVVPAPGFLKGLREICDRHGIMLIADEVQSGVGRTGKMWAFEHEGIVPDIVASAKGLGGGLPFGAMIAREEVSRQWQPGSHGNTYGGNGLTCAVAHELLTMVEEELMANAAQVGAHLMARLEELKGRFPQIGAVRGRGLMLGVEFIDPATGQPAGKLADAIMEDSFLKGLLVLSCGASTIRFCPPLTLSEAQADEAAERFALAIAACLE